LARKANSASLNIDSITLDDLVMLAEKLESSIRAYLKQKLPSKDEFDITISIEKREGLTISIDIGIIGKYEDLLDYKAIIGDAINYARKVFETELEKYRRTHSEDSKSTS